MAKVVFLAAIAHSSPFFANPEWGAEGLPRNAAGDVIINRWIQPGESFWFNPASWVNLYQHYCHQIDSAPKLEVELPDPPGLNPETASNEAQKPEPAPEAAEASVRASDSVAQPEADQAPPAPDQAEAKPEEPAPKPAAAPKKKTSAPKPKAEAAAAPKPEADQAPPAPDQAEAKPAEGKE